MITEFFLDLLATVVEWFVGLFPPWEPDAWFVGVGDTVNGVLGQLAGTGAWIEWTVVAACLGSVLASWLLFGGIKLLRAAAGHIPLAGGNG